MSYNIDILCAAPCAHCSGADLNITYNVRSMFEAATGLKSLRELSGKQDRALHYVEMAITMIENKPLRIKPHEAKNGWGTMDQFYDFLKRFEYELHRYPGGRVHVT